MTLLTADETHLVHKLFDSAFRGYAETRLGKLKPHVLDELVRMCRDAETAKLPDDASTDAKVQVIMDTKQKLLEVQRRAADAEVTVKTSVPPDAKAAPAPAVAPAPQTKPTKPVFKPQHELHIIAFNCLKLRLDREELQEEWDAAVLEFAKYDVLMLSEVRASDKLFQSRIVRLAEMLHECTEAEWEWQISEPSGPGAKEVHLVLAKRPLNIANVATLGTIDGTKMDHAPFVVTLDDPRFVGELRRLNVVSVHLPPKSSRQRRAERDVQIQALVRAYAENATTRLNTPFSNLAAKETRKKHPYVAHIIGGDFNADARELRELQVERHGWEIVLGSVRTSSGGKSYDNWLLSRDSKDHLTVGADVLDLTQYANFSRGQQGISDHAPIALRIKEIPRIAAPPVAQTRAAQRKARAGAMVSAWLHCPTQPMVEPLLF